MKHYSNSPDTDFNMNPRMQHDFDVKAHGLLAMTLASASSRAAFAEGYRCLRFVSSAM